MNLPQIRISPDSSERVRALARSFGAPITITSAIREGSLRAAAGAIGVETLLYEAGEALRFDELPVRAGVRGILAVLQALDMLASRHLADRRRTPLEVSESRWVRAPRGGILRTFKSIGAAVEKGERIGVISDPFGDAEVDVLAGVGGLIIGRTMLPIVNSGDALLNIAHLHDPNVAEEHVENVHDSLESDPLLDDGDGS